MAHFKTAPHPTPIMAKKKNNNMNAGEGYVSGWGRKSFIRQNPIVSSIMPLKSRLFSSFFLRNVNKEEMENKNIHAPPSSSLNIKNPKPVPLRSRSLCTFKKKKGKIIKMLRSNYYIKYLHRFSCSARNCTLTCQSHKTGSSQSLPESAQFRRFLH